VKKKKTQDMLEIMDTYNHDDMHHQYGKNENYNHISMIMNRVPKKMQSHLSHRISPGDPCRVCGFEKNTGRNFGVITCSTCKAFFRRNGRTGSVSRSIGQRQSSVILLLGFTTLPFWWSMSC
jgi:predicted Zn-ribbon and HTH transcriptional regulator